MAVERVGGSSDPRVALYRGVSDRALLDAYGLFIAEGRLVVERLIDERQEAVRSVLVNEAAYGALQTKLDGLAARVPIYICPADQFLGITGHDLHRGCLALGVRPPSPTISELLEGVSRQRSLVTIVVLEAVTNADNVGVVFRNAAALGGDAVLLSPGCCDPLYRKAIRTSMAATLRVPFARVDEWPGGLEILREHGFALIALTPRTGATTVEALAASRPARVALLVGTEGEGLTPAVQAAADLHVHIPIAASVDSLNLAVAVGIALHRLGTVRSDESGSESTHL
jgi:tRNA G18 (ribose-2'-O)-methylase SpoU